MPAIRQLSPEERNKIILRHEEGQKQKTIGSNNFFPIFYKNLDDLGISQSCVSKTIKIYKQTGSTMPLKRSGRPKILSPRTESILIRDVKRNCHKTSASISNELKKNMNISISPPTIRKILINNDLRAYKSVKKPLIGKNITKKRLIFCQKYKEINWNNVIFSDESQFTCNYSNQPPLVRRPKGSSLLPRYLTKTVKFPQSVMIWGCFRGNKLGTLYIVEGSMNSAQYLKVLEKKMLPFYNQDSNSIF